MGRSVLLSVALLILAIGAGCGGGDESEAPSTRSGGASGPTGPTGPVPANNERDRQSPVEAVEDFYAHLNAGRYSEAWAQLPVQVQSESGGFTQWRSGYDTTVSSELVRAELVETAGGIAVVAITLRATDRDACTSERVEQVFEGEWTLGRAGDAWDAESIQLDKVSGATPTLSAENCPHDQPPPAPPPAPPPPDNDPTCTPGYSPCLTPASDYDCEGGTGDGPEYTGFVQVSGSDPYGLDADGDGLGCE